MSEVRLTRREREVLGLLALGRSYSQIGCELNVSLHTVASHIKNTYRKLEVHRASAAVMRAIQLRLLAD